MMAMKNWRSRKAPNTELRCVHHDCGSHRHRARRQRNLRQAPDHVLRRPFRDPHLDRQWRDRQRRYLGHAAGLRPYATGLYQAAGPSIKLPSAGITAVNGAAATMVTGQKLALALNNGHPGKRRRLGIARLDLDRHRAAREPSIHRVHQGCLGPRYLGGPHP